MRHKVIDAIELDGMKKSEASAIFGISRNTTDLWLKRKAATGSAASLAILFIRWLKASLL